MHGPTNVKNLLLRFTCKSKETFWATGDLILRMLHLGPKWRQLVSSTSILSVNRNISTHRIITQNRYRQNGTTKSLLTPRKWNNYFIFRQCCLVFRNLGLNRLHVFSGLLKMWNTFGLSKYFCNIRGGFLRIFSVVMADGTPTALYWPCRSSIWIFPAK